MKYIRSVTRYARERYGLVTATVPRHVHLSPSPTRHRRRRARSRE
jgi:hypothetical protein